MELLLISKGENLDPLQWEREEGDTGRSVQRVLSPLVWNQHVATAHAYVSGRNIVSIASPGTTGAWTILFAALAFPGDYVGMFMTYRLACGNYNAAYGALQVGLEQIEAADKFGAIDLEKLRDEKPRGESA